MSDEIVILADSMINEVDGNIEKALNAATCVTDLMLSVCDEIRRRLELEIG